MQHCTQFYTSRIYVLIFTPTIPVYQKSNTSLEPMGMLLYIPKAAAQTRNY